LSDDEIHRRALEHALKGYVYREVHVQMLLDWCTKEAESMLATGGSDAHARNLQAIVKAVRSHEVM
jgi:hypothetical protein